MEPRLFRSPRSLWVVMWVLFALFLGLAIFSFLLEMEWWYRTGFLVFLGLCPVGLVELAMQRVELRGDQLTVVNNFRRKTLFCREVEAVTWAKGMGVAVRRVDGTWVRLPPVGSSAQGMTNTIRAWIRRGVSSGEES